MAKYQVQYKNNSKTFLDTLEAKSHLEIIELFKDLINCEITEIREILYTNSTYPPETALDNKSLSVRLLNDKNFGYGFKIPKPKKDINKTLLSLINSHLKVSNLKPVTIKF